MDTNEASYLTIFLSVMLGGIAAQAVVVAIFRILQILRAGDPASLTRIITLLAFAGFMAGSVGREAVVVVEGASSWGVNAILWSGVARAVQIVSAAVFIWVITKPICGHWMWTLSLAVAGAVSILVVR